MFGPAGVAYVFLIYGMHQMLNIVTGRTGDAQAVLLRAAEPLDGWDANLTGPGRLARALCVKRSDNGQSVLTTDWHVLHRENPPRVLSGPRVGVEYALQWKDAPLRFADGDSPAVSKPRVAGLDEPLPSAILRQGETPLSPRAVDDERIGRSRAESRRHRHERSRFVISATRLPYSSAVSMSPRGGASPVFT